MINAFAILLNKDWHIIVNLKRLAQEQSKFKIIFIMSFALSLLAGLWLLFLNGFQFLNSMGGIGVVIIHNLFAILFFGLGIMLMISNFITSYTTIFRSEETPFLLLHPISRGEITMHKLLESTLLSSWAFFFIIIPFVGAYAWQQKLSIIFVVNTFLFSIPFVIFYSSMGMIVTILVVRWLPRIRPIIWLMIIALAGCGLFFLTDEVQPETNDVTFLLSRLTPGMKLASYPLWPSWWVSEGIMASARGQWTRATLFFSVLIANVLALGLLVEGTGNICLSRGWQKVMTAQQKIRGRHKTIDFLGKVTPFLASDSRAIMLKDIRILVRDPVQWTQGFLFFGLLGLYFFNLRNLHYHLLPLVWRNLITFLNVFSLSAVMCSFCSRFVYPQLSLEGHGFWILGLAPTTMKRVLMTKFQLAVVSMLAVSLSLLAVSMFMLKVEPCVWLISLVIAVAMSFALCGLSTGLGAVFLDLKQSNPSAIISGFGGTLNLVLSLCYMIIIILPYGMLYHGYYTHLINVAQLHRGLTLASIWLLIITVGTTILPLIAGRKSLLSRDY